MGWKCFFVSVFLLNVLWSEILAEEEKMCQCILIGVTDDVSGCEGDDWKDPPVKVNMKMKLEEAESEGEPDLVKLEGDVDVGKEVVDGYQVNININLETPNGRELVWSGGAEVCKSLDKNEIIKSIFNTTECPITIDVYQVPGMMLKLDFLKGAISRDFLGTYSIGVSIEQGMDKVMCLEIGSVIYEEELACKYCPDQEQEDE